MRVLVLEDQEDIRHLVCATLRRNGYAVEPTSRAQEALNLAEVYPFDLMILDVGLPEGSKAGFELLQRMREQGIYTPVLFLTAYAHPDDRIQGLDAGADDYLVKPFNLGELLARLRALLRRQRTDHGVWLEYQGLRVNWNTRQVSLQDKPIHLTAKEFALLEVLASHRGRVYTRQELIDHIWEGVFDTDANVVEVLVRNLRRKLGDEVIETVRGSGYRFSTNN